MAKAIPNPEPQRNSSKSSGERSGLRRQVMDSSTPFPELTGWGTNTTEARLGEARVLGEGGVLQLEPALPIQGDPEPTDPWGAPLHGQEPGSNGDNLKAENLELRQVIAELRRETAEITAGAEKKWGARQQEYESMLEEKTEVIRQLHQKIQQLEEQIPKKPTPKEEELHALAEELEQERCQVEQERRQLDDDLRQFQEDEKVMTEQMRTMEVEMARERADLARQRTEISRMIDEARHEMDRFERDRGLTDKLLQLRQRFQDVEKGNIGAALPSDNGYQANHNHSLSRADVLPRNGPAPSKKKDSGLLRRLFGG